MAWRIRLGRAQRETAVARIGMVDIVEPSPLRRVATSVNGDAAGARQTGLHRLARYFDGENSGAVQLNPAGPVTLEQIAPSRWRITLPLPTPVAPAPRSPKVKLLPPESDHLAVIAMTGPINHDTAARGDAAILATLAGSQWIPIGAPLLRPAVDGPWWLFRGRHQVVVPVRRRLAPPREA